MIQKKDIDFLLGMKDRIEGSVSGVVCELKQKFYGEDDERNYPLLVCSVKRDSPYMDFSFEVCVSMEGLFPVFSMEVLSEDKKDRRICRRIMEPEVYLGLKSEIDLFGLWVEDTIGRFWMMKEDFIDKKGIPD